MAFRASPMGLQNEKPNIKKYYFGFFMFILHTLKKELNKILKYLFFFTNTIPTSLKKAKTNKVRPLKKYTN